MTRTEWSWGLGSVVAAIGIALIIGPKKPAAIPMSICFNYTQGITTGIPCLPTDPNGNIVRAKQ